MTATAPVYGAMGTLSSGTMRPSDLIPAFSSELCDLANMAGTHATYADLLAEATAWEEADYLDEDERPEDFDESQHDEDGAEIVDDLMTALGDFAPPYFYFGAHPGDGADYGFWLSESMPEDFAGLRVDDTSEVPADYVGEVLHVNDHGNMTLYVASPGAELVEVWGVV